MSQQIRDGYVLPPAPARLLARLYLSVFGRKFFYRWNELLFGVAVRGMCVSDPSMKTIGSEELGFMRRLAKIPNLTVFDVGANVGHYSLQLKKLSRTARVWAFEPHPTTFKALASAAATGGFTAVNSGLSDSGGRTQLYDYVNESGDIGSPHASLHRQVIEDLHRATAAGTEVTLTTVDDIMRDEGIAQLSLLKIDAEGHELAILIGAVQTISAGRVDVVQFEFNEMNVISRVFLRDFYRALPGFSLYRIVTDGLAPLGAYRARTHELFFRHNLVAIRDGLNYGPELV